MVFLPYEWELRDAINRIAKFLADYRKRHPGKKTFRKTACSLKAKKKSPVKRPWRKPKIRHKV